MECNIFDISDYGCLESFYPLDQNLELKSIELMEKSTSVKSQSISTSNQTTQLMMHQHMQYLHAISMIPIVDLPIIKPKTWYINKKIETYKLPERSPQWHKGAGMECEELPVQLPNHIRDIYLHLNNVRITNQLHRHYSLRTLRLQTTLDTTMYTLHIENLQCTNYTLYDHDKLHSIVVDSTLTLMAPTKNLIYIRAPTIKNYINIVETSVRFMDVNNVKQLLERTHNVEYLTIRSLHNVVIDTVPSRVKYLRLIGKNPETIKVSSKVLIKCKVFICNASHSHACYNYKYWKR